jgi:hypothetical protein
MNSRSLGALIALNVLLLAALAVTSMTPTQADGQLLRYGRPSYRMVGGLWTGSGGNRSMIYIVDNSTSRLLAFQYNASDIRNRAQAAPVRVIDDDLRSRR